MDGPKWNPDLGGEKRVTSSVRCGRFKVILVSLMWYLGVKVINESAKDYREFMSGTAEEKYKIMY